MSLPVKPFLNFFFTQFFNLERFPNVVIPGVCRLIVNRATLFALSFLIPVYLGTSSILFSVFLRHSQWLDFSPDNSTLPIGASKPGKPPVGALGSEM